MGTLLDDDNDFITKWNKKYIINIKNLSGIIIIVKYDDVS